MAGQHLVAVVDLPAIAGEGCRGRATYPLEHRQLHLRMQEVQVVPHLGGDLLRPMLPGIWLRELE
jgi:hypothetical protein